MQVLHTGKAAPRNICQTIELYFSGDLKEQILGSNSNMKTGESILELPSDQHTQNSSSYQNFPFFTDRRDTTQ